MRKHLFAATVLEGEAVQLVEMELDADHFLAAANVGATGPVARALDSITEASFRMETFIGADGRIRVTHLDGYYVAMDTRVNLDVRTEMSEYNQRFEFPLEEPYPSCAQRPA